ncbi:MAG: DNA mismatch endonuclease Vsr [Akkermansia sp.]|nr:DNA mismatch endonuclease Vsr [Akkermansia sp.]
MSAIKGKNTKPEIVVRKVLHALGYRFRLHYKDLPGKPDIILPRYKTVIFVNGCFWHRHPGCRYASMPSTNVEFWRAKFRENVERDLKNYSRLRDMGWNVAVLWTCEIKSLVQNEEISFSLDEIIKRGM